MPWAKLDDQFHGNPKVRKAWRRCPASLGLHVMAITYSSAHLLDGRVLLEFVEDQIPKPAVRQQAVDALLEAELWSYHADGWEINDYLVYNPSKKDVLERRRKASENGHLGGVASGEARRR